MRHRTSADFGIPIVNEIGSSDNDSDDSEADDNKENDVAEVSNASANQHQSGREAALVAARRASDLQEELAQLDPETLLENFSDLDGFATKVIDLAAPRHKQIDDYRAIVAALETKSRSRTVLNRYTTIFNGLREMFGSQSLIQPDLVLRAITGTPNLAFTSLPWTPHDLIFKSNLASLVLCLNGADGLLEATHDLELLDNAFPRSFMQSLVYPENATKAVGESTLCEDTRHVALGLRTQFAIFKMLTITRPSVKSLKATVCTTFLDSELLDSEATPWSLIENPQAYRPWYGDAFSDAADDFAHDQLERVRVLYELLEDEDIEDPEDRVENMTTRFPFIEFRAELHQWIGRRHAELAASMDDRGGRDMILSQLQAKFEQRTRPPQAPRQVSSSGPRKSSMALLKSMTGPSQTHTQDSSRKASAAPLPVARAGSAAPSQPRQPGRGTAPQDRTTSRQTSAVSEPDRRVVSVPPDDPTTHRLASTDPAMPAVQEEFFVDNNDVDDVELNESVTESVQNKRIAKARRDIEEKRRQVLTQRRFVDRQNDAAKVAWNDDGDSPHRSVSNAETTSSAGRSHKRRRIEQTSEMASSRDADPETITVADDDAADDNFDPTPDDGFEQDQREPTTRRRSGMPWSDGASGHEDTNNAASAPTRSRRAARVVPDEIQPEAATQQIRDINANAQIHAPTRRIGQDGRLPFSVEEDRALIKAIADRGASWAVIFTADQQGANIFRERKNGTALRDRAQQIKMDLLM